MGVVYDTPHGVACVTMLPIVMAFNADVTRERYKAIAEARVDHIAAAGSQQVDDTAVLCLDFLRSDTGNVQNAVGVKAAAGIQEILDASIGVLGTTLMLADASYYIMAHAEVADGKPDDDAYYSVQTHGIMGIDHILNVELDSKIRECRRHSYIQDTGGFTYDSAVRNLFTSGNHWGWLISVSPTQTRGKMDIQDELGDILEQWMQINQESQKKWEQSGIFLRILDENYPSKDRCLCGDVRSGENRVLCLGKGIRAGDRHCHRPGLPGQGVRKQIVNALLKLAFD